MAAEELLLEKIFGISAGVMAIVFLLIALLLNSDFDEDSKGAGAVLLFLFCLGTILLGFNIFLIITLMIKTGGFSF